MSYDEKDRTIDALEDALRFKRQRDKALRLLSDVLARGEASVDTSHEIMDLLHSIQREDDEPTV